MYKHSMSQIRDIHVLENFINVPSSPVFSQSDGFAWSDPLRGAHKAGLPFLRLRK